MGKNSRNKRKQLEKYHLIYFDMGTSLSTGKLVTKKRKLKAMALAIDIRRRYSLLGRKDPINKEEEEAIIKIKGEALIEKEGPRAFMILIRLEGIRLRMVRNVKRGITTLNHSKAEPIRLLKDVLCQILGNITDASRHPHDKTLLTIRDAKRSDVLSKFFHEFYSTYEFDEVCDTGELRTKKIIKFRLYGRAFSWILLEFAKRLGLYNSEEIEEEGFAVYFQSGFWEFVCEDMGYMEKRPGSDEEDVLIEIYHWAVKKLVEGSFNGWWSSIRPVEHYVLLRRSSSCEFDMTAAGHNLLCKPRLNFFKPSSNVTTNSSKEVVGKVEEYLGSSSFPVEGQRESWHGHVTTVTVAPQFHKQQLAKKLMNLLEDINDKMLYSHSEGWSFSWYPKQLDHSLMEMDDPDITMEEYIRLETEKALRKGKVYNWETATYGKIMYDEDVHFLRYVETKFPAIVYNDALTSELELSCEPTIFNVDDLKLDMGNGDDKIDIKQSSGDLSMKPLPNVINTDVGAYAQGSNKLLETSHDTSRRYGISGPALHKKPRRIKEQYVVRIYHKSQENRQKQANTNTEIRRAQKKPRIQEKSTMVKLQSKKVKPWSTEVNH
ncbi:hypothetical protein Tco_0824741 [Tanacetum coccineum]|uniref:Uncharacterized protein n=1 Tax=Tanacetum coccineum TaxID=301880 RepID=A0ABQ5AP81_9ASTR